MNTSFPYFLKPNLLHNDTDVLARTLYGEARGEIKTVGIASIIAIGNVVMNRLSNPHRFGKTITQICLKPKQFSCWNTHDPNYGILQGHIENSVFDQCLWVADNLIKNKWPDLTNGSNHYHSIAIPLPPWAMGKKPKITLGNHIFYTL